MTVVHKNSLPFRSLLNKADSQPIESGQPIYEWDYVDENGELQHEKRNVQEQIQSFARQCDYKKLYEQGEIAENANALYMDTTKLGTGAHDFYDNLVDLVKACQVDIQGQNNSGQAPEVDKQTSEVAKEVPTDKTGKGE